MQSWRRRTLHAPIKEVEDDHEESKSEYSFDFELDHGIHKHDYMSTNLVYQPNINVSDVTIEEITTHAI
jgi:hypothetical protein